MAKSSMENTTELTGGNGFVFLRSLPAKLGIGLVACAILLGVTNPNKDAYAQHIAWKFKEQICKETPITASARLTCAILSPMPHDWTASLLKGYSRRDNYVLFSIYTTEFSGLKNRSIGIAGHFL
jgi:Na+/H+ antiporter NhaB